MHVLKRNDLVDVPWKNGGGLTRNIAKGLVEDRVAWTISRADVAQDGPFSDFAGMTRILTVVSGGEMMLQGPSHTINALMWHPVRFDGALKIKSRLMNGPLTDLNLMFAPDLCAGTVTVRRGPFSGLIDRPAHGLIGVHVLAGAPQINDTDLTVGDTAFVDDTNVDLHLDQDDAVLDIRLEYISHKEAIKLCIASL